MPDEINVAFVEEEKLEFKPIKPAASLNSLCSDDDIISPVSNDAKQARIALQNEYNTQKNSFSKSKSVVNATNLYHTYRSRLPR